MPPLRLPISTLLSRLRVLRSGVFPPTHETLPTGQQQLTAYGTVLRIAQGALALHICAKYIISIQQTEGISMMPTIPHSYQSSPRVLVSKLHNHGRNVKVGDVIVFTHPMDPSHPVAKRIIGMPGDFVCVVNHGKTDEEVEETELVKSKILEEMVQVPEGHCWVIGDNMEWSRDSRLFGPVPLALVRGKILGLLWPWRDRKWFSNPFE